jgi:hypothetical protein
VTLESVSVRLLGCYCRQLRRSCADAHVTYSRADCVLIHESFFSTRSFAAVREAFSKAYCDREIAIRPYFGTQEAFTTGNLLGVEIILTGVMVL